MMHSKDTLYGIGKVSSHAFTSLKSFEKCVSTDIPFFARETGVKYFVQDIGTSGVGSWVRVNFASHNLQSTFYLVTIRVFYVY